MSTNYDQTIKHLDGLDAIRKRPGMYIDSTDINGLHHLINEVISNSIDEAINGFGNKITVTIHKDKSVSIQDDGRGIPVEINKETNIPSIHLVFTKLHAGGKFDDSNYKSAGGLHGVGLTVINALSKKVLVTVYRNGFCYETTFIDGVPGDVQKISATNRTGTNIRFYPDERYFSIVEFNYNMIKVKLEQNAYLLPTVKFVLDDERGGHETETFFFPLGLVAYLDYLNESELVFPALSDTKEEKVMIQQNNGGKAIEKTIKIVYALSYNKEFKEQIAAFANNILNNEGGTHVTGLKSAFTSAVNDYARKNNLIKDRDPNFEGKYVNEGLTAVISVYIPEDILAFQGQTKSKLNTIQVKALVEKIIYEKVSYFFAENREIATSIVKMIQKSVDARKLASKTRLESLSSKELIKVANSKLSPALSNKPEEKELFIVEGDSAGGSAKSGRDSKTQAILPLRGKVVNTEELSINKILENEEIKSLIAAIGAGVGKDFELKNTKYHKIIIMTDADNDGAHIQILLLTFFYRFMKPLIDEGYVYIAKPPLYKVYKGSGKNEVFKYCYNLEDLALAKVAIGTGYSIQRYKGLGEMNANQLWDTTMSKVSRMLIRVNIDDVTMAERRLKELMGKDPELRKIWISSNVNFIEIDELLEGKDE